MKKDNQKIVFSGIKPSGELTIGNYLGAIVNWLKMQDNYQCIFCVVDYHAITVKQDPKLLRQRILDITKIYLASGINPRKSIIFQQSDISEHTELAWILNTVTSIYDLNKMTQFKDMVQKNKNNINAGIYDYPVLMASDILLYDTDEVPVGEDQVQHVELTRTIARKFNQRFGDIFKLPRAVLQKEGARIMGLNNPLKKMSKSNDNANNYIALNDDPDIASKKIMRAVTDSGKEIKFDKENKPAIANLLTVYALLTDKKITDLEKQYQNAGYGDFKKDLAVVVKNFLIDFQKKLNKISDKDAQKILEEGAKKVKLLAHNKMKIIKKQIGIN